MNRLLLRAEIIARVLKHDIRCVSTLSKPNSCTFQHGPTTANPQHLISRNFAAKKEKKEKAPKQKGIEAEDVPEIKQNKVEHVAETVKDTTNPQEDAAFFSGPSVEQRLVEYPDLYYQPNELIITTEADVGKWFSCDEVLLTQYPLKNKWINKSVQELFDMSGKYLMMRQPAFDLITAFKDIMSNKKAEANGAVIGVYGPRGSGKSCTLHTLTQAALQHPNKWLVIGLNAREVVADHHGFLYPSPSRDGVHMQGRWCKNFFQNLLDTQGELLKQISLKRTYSYDWILRGETGHLIGMGEDARAQMDSVATTSVDGKTVHDLVTYGAGDSALAAECMYDFVEECILANEVHILVSMDGINIWDEKSEFRDPANPFLKLDPRQLSAVNALSKFMRVGPQSGMSVFCTTSAATMNMSKTHMAAASYALEIPIYSNKEISQCVWHYKISKFLFAEVDVFLLARVKGMTGGVPRDIFNDCSVI